MVRSAAWLIVVALASSCVKEPSSHTARARAEPSPPGGGGEDIRVGNQAKGIDEQPDYNAQAEEIRQRLEGRLPSPLPSAKAACNTMFDAVIASYRRSDGDGARSVTLLEQTRAADQVACETETKPVAAACVAVLITQDGGEFAWLLDQCSRAFAG